MTFASSFFLLALLAVPILVVLNWLSRRPRRIVVPSTEIWARIVPPTTAVSAQKKPRVDARLITAITAAVMLAFAASDLGWFDSQATPRHVRVVIDRSAPMQWPITAADAPDAPDASNRSALHETAAWLGAFAARLESTDRLQIEFVPPLLPSVVASAQLLPATATPTATADALREAIRTGRIGATDAEYREWAQKMAELAEWAAPTDTADTGTGTGTESRWAIAFTTRPANDTSTPTSTPASAVESAVPANVTVVRWPRSAVLHVVMVAADATGIFVRVAWPNGARKAAPETEVRVWAVNADGVRIAPGGDAAAVPMAVRTVPSVAPGESRRMWIEIGALAEADAFEVEIPGAWPTVRALARYRQRVAILSMGQSPTELATVRAWITAMLPAVEVVPVTIAESTPEAVAEAVRQAGIVGALIAVGTSASEPFDRSLPVQWRRLPILALGAVAAPTNPLVDDGGEGANPLRTVALSTVRRVWRPEHPVMLGVDVARLPADTAIVAPPALDATTWTALVTATPTPATVPANNNAGDDDAEAADVPVIVAGVRGGRRAVWVATPTALTRWPTAGMAGTVMVANALAWLLDDAESIEAESDWLAGMAGADSQWPRSVARRFAMPGASMGWRPFAVVENAASASAEHPIPLREWPERAGWLIARSAPREVLADGAIGVEQIMLPVNAAQLDPWPMAPPAVPTVDATADRLPSVMRQTFSSARFVWLFTALVALVGFAYFTLRRRHRPHTRPLGSAPASALGSASAPRHRRVVGRTTRSS